MKPADFFARFKLEDIDLEAIDSYELLNVIGKKRRYAHFRRRNRYRESRNYAA